MFQNQISAHQLEHDFIDINLDNPPCVPQLDVPPVMYGYIARISALLARAIQQRAEDTALRRIIFNLTAYNRFNNDIFVSMVEQAVMDLYISVRVERKYEHFEDGFDAVVRDTILRTMAQLYYENPNVRQIARLQPSEETYINQAYSLYQQYVQRVEQLSKASAMQPQQYPQGTTMYPGQPYPQYPQYPNQPQQAQPYPQYPNQGAVYGGPAPYPGQPYPNAPMYGAMPVQPMQYPNQQPYYPNQPRVAYPQPMHNPAQHAQQPQMGYGFTQPRTYSDVPDKFSQRDYSRGNEGVGIGQRRQAPQRAQQPQEGSRPMQPAFTPRTQGVIEPTYGKIERPIPPGSMVGEEEIGRYYLQEFDGSLKWVPTDYQPFFPAWNKNTHKPYYKVFIDRDLIAIALIPISEQDVDYEKHKTTAVIAAERELALKQAMNSNPVEVNAEELLTSHEVIEVAEEEHHVVKSDEIYNSIGEVVVVTQAMRNRLVDKVGVQETPTIVTHETYVVDTMNVAGATSEDMHKLKNLCLRLRTSSLRESASILREAREEHRHSGCINAFILQLDHAYTKAVMHQLTVRLQITAASIDSFMDDYIDLIEGMNIHFGQTTTMRLSNAGPAVNRMVFGEGITGPTKHAVLTQIADKVGVQTVNDEGAALDYTVIEDAILDAGFILVVRKVSVTLVNLSSEELGIGIPDDISGGILADLTPMLAAISTRILSDKRVGAENYIVTLDNKRFKVDTGLIDSDFHVIYT